MPGLCYEMECEEYSDRCYKQVSKDQPKKYGDLIEKPEFLGCWVWDKTQGAIFGLQVGGLRKVKSRQ